MHLGELELGRGAHSRREAEVADYVAESLSVSERQQGERERQRKQWRREQRASET
jgi:hypothetical protein